MISWSLTSLSSWFDWLVTGDGDGDGDDLVLFGDDFGPQIF